MWRGNLTVIDTKLLPYRALLDTGVVIRALRERDDMEAKLCQDLWDLMASSQREILIAAPSLAEITRGGGKGPPRVRGIEVVSFDLVCAEVLGARLPQSLLKTAATAADEPVSYYKYDALIIACAIRHRADMIISLDARLIRLASEADMSAKRPSDLVMPMFANLAKSTESVPGKTQAR